MDPLSRYTPYRGTRLCTSGILLQISPHKGRSQESEWVSACEGGTTIIANMAIAQL